jgi:hypothetical protein
LERLWSRFEPTLWKIIGSTTASSMTNSPKDVWSLNKKSPRSQLSVDVVPCSPIAFSFCFCLFVRSNE